VSGEMHPLRVYIHAGVPVALATDDEGVSRSSLTAEFLEAVKDQGLTYTELKRMVRTGLDHAFLPGAGLWKTPGGLSIAGECSNDLPSSRRSVSGACAQFLKNNRKAALEWELEREFAEFEKSVVRKN
ncbi:MAG TPA: adenosine deaminase, partial [Blastocatellia bacterium]|nr:adenosine deaminase [Blastocatellia bacterium]